MQSLKLVSQDFTPEGLRARIAQDRAKQVKALKKRLPPSILGRYV